MAPRKSVKLAVAALLASSIAGCSAFAEELTITTVNNADMIIMQKLSPAWEEATGNTLSWVVLEENALRQCVTTGFATKGGQFDIITISAYEAPIWGGKGGLSSLDDLGADYDYADIYDTVRNGLSADGKCATWIDATLAAGAIFNPKQSKVATTTDFTQAPKQVADMGTGWFWAWALAVPASSQKLDAAKSFLKWSTSKEYVEMVGETEGWAAAPPGTRKSTYANPRYLAEAPFAKTVENSILAANPADSTLLEVPYTGVQFVAIPKFQGTGNYVDQQISAAPAGSVTVDEALANSQNFAKREMEKAGYIKLASSFRA